MKLLYCKKCADVINLMKHTKACSCGKTEGRYIDENNAEYSGDDAVPFAIDNFSFYARMKNDEEHKPHNEFYDKLHGKNKIQCWMLQEGNPNFETIKKVEKRVEQKVKSLGRC